MSIRLSMTFKELNPVYSGGLRWNDRRYGGWLLMGYFRELPNIAYQSPLLHKNSSLDYVVIKKFIQTYKTF